jgi:hypothetical protein
MSNFQKWLTRRLLEFDSEIENIIYHYLASQELQKTTILSHGCRELKRLYHENSRVAASWPVVITCSNSVITLSYYLKIAGR